MAALALALTRAVIVQRPCLSQERQVDSGSSSDTHKPKLSIEYVGERCYIIVKYYYMLGFSYKNRGIESQKIRKFL